MRLHFADVMRREELVLHFICGARTDDAGTTMPVQ